MVLQDDFVDLFDSVWTKLVGTHINLDYVRVALKGVFQSFCI